MTYAVFFDIFWPMVDLFVLVYVVIPLLVTALSVIDRRQRLKRMHRARRKRTPVETHEVSP